MGQAEAVRDVFGEYVTRRLDDWGHEFALHRDMDYLGHMSKNLLQVLIEHRGMPPRSTGFKPLVVPALAQQIEDVVTEIARSDMPMACTLRAYYCGMGRRKVERYETGINLITNAGKKPISVAQYMTLARLGFQRVRGRLEGLAVPA